MGIKAYHGRASESVRPVNRVHGQGWEWPTPASGGMEDGRSRYAALPFPIIAVLCGKIKEQCLEREGRVGKFGFVGGLGFLVLCLPQRGRGTAKRWMRRASFRSVSGMIFLGVSRGFRIHPYEKTNPLSSSTTYGGPPSPLGKAHGETRRSTPICQIMRSISHRKFLTPGPSGSSPHTPRYSRR